MFYQLKVVEESDLAKLASFVEKAGVSSEGFESLLDYFVMMENGENEAVACMGVKPVDEHGLLRSLVISDKLKQAHILTLFQSIQTLAEQKGLTHLYLVTNKEASVQFLSIMGFEEIEKASIPQQLLSLNHMRESLKEANAKVMVRSS